MASRWFALLVLLAGPVVARAQDSGIEIGATGPAAEVETLDGGTANLSQFVGKGPVLFEFWATWCPNCRALEPRMSAAMKKYAGKVTFVAVAVSVNQSLARIKAYREQHDLPPNVFFDRRGDAVTAYDVPATSYIVVLDAAGKVVYTGVGSDQDIDAAVRKGL
jgi:thiol-disulfide isomerase/thioredoxin